MRENGGVLEAAKEHFQGLRELLRGVKSGRRKVLAQDGLDQAWVWVKIALLDEEESE